MLFESSNDCPAIFCSGAQNVNPCVTHWYTNMGITEGDLGNYGGTNLIPQEKRHGMRVAYKVSLVKLNSTARAKVAFFPHHKMTSARIVSTSVLLNSLVLTSSSAAGVHTVTVKSHLASIMATELTAKRASCSLTTKAQVC